MYCGREAPVEGAAAANPTRTATMRFLCTGGWHFGHPIFIGLRCKSTHILHLAPRFRRTPVQKHPHFAPGTTFSPASGAKIPTFCTWHHVFAGLRCKSTHILHLAPRFRRPPVQKHPHFAPGEDKKQYLCASNRSSNRPVMKSGVRLVFLFLEETPFTIKSTLF